MFAGMETSSSGGGLQFELAIELIQVETVGAKIAASKTADHEQALRTRQLANVATVGTSASAYPLRFISGT